MNRRDYLTTGEAADMLRISRSTVSRMFDAGQLSGKINPLTHQRLISRDSVNAVIATHGLQGRDEATSPRILLASANAHHTEIASERVKALGRVSLEHSRTGAETLVICARNPPQLLILDSSLPDLPPVSIVTALRHKPDQGHVPIICLGLSDSDRATLPAGTAKLLPSPTLLAPGELENMITDVLGLKVGPKVGVSHFEHRRQWPRKSVSFPARVAVYSARRPRRSAWGTGTLRDISRGGAFIDKLQLDSTDLLTRPFRMLVELRDPPWAGWKAYCRVVRLASNGELSAGLAFIRTPRHHQNQLAAMLGEA